MNYVVVIIIEESGLLNNYKKASIINQINIS